MCEIFTEIDLLDVTAMAEKIAAEIMVEARPIGGVKPLSPDQMRKRQQRRDKAAANVHDVQSANAIKLRKAQRKVSEI